MSKSELYVRILIFMTKIGISKKAINPERVNFIQMWNDHELGEDLAYTYVYRMPMVEAGNPVYEANVWTSKCTVLL